MVERRRGGGGEGGLGMDGRSAEEGYNGPAMCQQNFWLFVFFGPKIYDGKQFTMSLNLSRNMLQRN